MKAPASHSNRPVPLPDLSFVLLTIAGLFSFTATASAQATGAGETMVAAESAAGGETESEGESGTGTGSEGESGTGSEGESGTGTGTGTEAEGESGTGTGTEAEGESAGTDVMAETDGEVEAGAEAEVTVGACPRTARQLGPSTAPLLDGMLGAPRRACFRTEVSLGGDAYLIAAPADFYGNIRVGGRVSGSVRINDLVEVWGTFEAVRWQYLLSAVSSTYLGTGYLTLGSSVRLLDEGGRRWIAWLRTVLPTSGLDQRSLPFAVELGTTAEWNAHPNLRLHAGLSVIGSVGISELAPALPRGGLRFGGGLDWIPWDALSFQLELQSGFGYRDGLDYLALAGGARLGFGDRIGVDLSVLWPFVGAERALLAAQLGISGRFDDP